VRLRAEVVSLDATGQLGELLRSGSLGKMLREKIRKAVESDLEKSANLRATLPAAVRDIAAVRTVGFRAGAGGRLELEMAGDVKLPPEQVQAAAAQLRRLARP
jgi:hypothetical protein